MAGAALSFSHMGMYVQDLALMEDFYSRVLGFTVTDRGELPTPGGRVGLVFLSRDPNEHHQVVLATGRPQGLAFNTINQISFRVPDLASLRHFDQALQGEKVTEVSPVTHGNAISIYFRDPEGNRIEIFLDTPWYCEQPCRETVDFSKSDAEIMRESETLARSLRGFQPREQWSAQLRRRMEANAGT